MPTQMHAQLKSVGCPDDHIAGVAAAANASGLSFDVVMKIYNWVQRYAPTLGVSCWNAVQELIAILKAPVIAFVACLALAGLAAAQPAPVPRPPQAPPIKTFYCECATGGRCICGLVCPCGAAKTAIAVPAPVAPVAYTYSGQFEQPAYAFQSGFAQSSGVCVGSSCGQSAAPPRRIGFFKR